MIPHRFSQEYKYMQNCLSLLLAQVLPGFPYKIGFLFRMGLLQEGYAEADQLYSELLLPHG
jgi:hypothetical protein